MRVRDPESFCPWIRDAKIRIRNTAKIKHALRNKFFQGCMSMSNFKNWKLPLWKVLMFKSNAFPASLIGGRKKTENNA